MYKSRWGFHSCSYEEFCELRSLWKEVLARRKMVAAWRRWYAKAAHNRVKRERIRDSNGHVVRYGQPVPMPEPPLPTVACRRVTRPSGKVEVEFAGPVGEALRRLQEAYRLARRPRATAAEVEPLPVTIEEVRAWRSVIGG
ncbi:MAG: hypothetical protein L0241_10235 [Planctomycetia bacterium]|nr:hypothetical protein [Planctomycetia bacterium]